jgi:fused signal recognition particle receptor
MIIFVGDALSGNDTIIQARRFDETVGIDCAILTKIDADAKGGAALSIAHAVGKPIAFIGVGQEYDDLISFSPQWMVERLFGEET